MCKTKTKWFEKCMEHYNEVAEEQKEYHKGESVKITYKYLNE